MNKNYKRIEITSLFVNFRRDIRFSSCQLRYYTYQDECDQTNEWWPKFNSLSNAQSTALKKIVAKSRFTEDYNTDDAAILEVLKYYKVKRD